VLVVLMVKYLDGGNESGIDDGKMV
jgi:hypothetical protein